MVYLVGDNNVTIIMWLGELSDVFVHEHYFIILEACVL